MRTTVVLVALCLLLGAFLPPTFSQVNNPQNPNAGIVQGPDPTGNQGYPFAVAPATGSTWTVNQGMPPWTVSQSGAWIVDINSFPGAPLGVTQSTSPWVVDASGFTVPVSGTFWQATQPVSGPLTDAQLRATPVPVSGTFWQATQPVSGTVTANAGTGTFTVAGTVTANAGTGTFTVDGSGVTQPVSATALPLPTGAATEATLAKVPLAQGSTTSGQSGSLIQGAVTTAAPTYTTAQTSPLSLTTAGGLRVDGSGSTQPISGTVTANAGTGTFTVDGSGHTQPVSGTVTANAGSGTFTVDGSGHTQPISAAALPLPSGAATEATLAKVPLTQGSTTSGQSGALIQGAVTTAAPSYTTAQTSPLSLNTAGGLRVDGSGVTQPVSGTVTANAGSGTFTVDGSGHTQPVSGTVTANAGSGTFTVGGTVTANAGSGTFGVNVAQVNGNTTVTAATGVQKVGVVGNAGATVDSTVAAGSAPTNQVVVGSVYNTSAPAPTNGQAMAQQADQAGNLRSTPGIATAALSAWTSATALNSTQPIYTNSGVSSVLVHLAQTSTLTAGAATFEITYDNSNWITVSADCVIDPTSTTLATISLPYTLQASTNKGFLILTKGAQGLRIKLSTQITGTGSVTPNYALLAYNAVQQTTAVQSGTWTVQPGNTANTTAWKVDGSAVNQPVIGPTAAGAAISLAPLVVAGENSGNVKLLHLNTAGGPTVDQGTGGSSAWKVDGSAVTQPVSGTVTANAGTGTFATNLQGATNVISTANSSTTPLLAAGTFTGTGEDVSNYAAITVNVTADSRSSPCFFEWSSDNSNWDIRDEFGIAFDAVTADTIYGHSWTLTPKARFFRVVYANSGSLTQTFFRLQTIYHTLPVNEKQTNARGSVQFDTNNIVKRVPTNGYTLLTLYIGAGVSSYTLRPVNSQAIVNLPIYDVSNQQWITTISFPAGGSGVYQIPVAGYAEVQITPTVTTGTTNLIYDLSYGSFTSPQANQGDPNTVANSWPVEVTDGTNVLGTVAHPLKVDGSGVTQPVSGTVAVSGTTTVSGTVAVSGTTTVSGTVTQNINTGRTELRYYATNVAAGTTTTETAISLTKSSGTSATAAATSFVVTNGKKFRITSISVATRGNATATIQTTTFNFRINTAGAVTTSSTPIILAVRSATPATASAWDRYTVPLGEGLEIPGDGTLQFGVTAAATYTTNAPTWDVTILGYEY